MFIIHIFLYAKILTQPHSNARADINFCKEIFLFKHTQNYTHTSMHTYLCIYGCMYECMQNIQRIIFIHSHAHVHHWQTAVHAFCEKQKKTKIFLKREMKWETIKTTEKYTFYMRTQTYPYTICMYAYMYVCI